MRFDPFREFDRLAQQVFTPGRPSAMPMDAFRQDSMFVIRFDLPGVPRDAIDMTVEKNVLTVTAERTWNQDAQDEVLVAERPHGRFSRQLFLGESLDASRIEADFTDGVLTITIPVAEEAKPRRIELSGTHTPISTTAEETVTPAEEPASRQEPVGASA
jgi:HSP20 family protein